MGLRFKPAALVGSLFAGHLVTAADFSLNGREEIIASAKTLAEDLVSSHYPDTNEPGTIPGLLSDETYYFWQAGAFMGHMINYWHLTDDDQFNGLVARGMRHQVGQDNDFMPANQTRDLMNDDQCTWGSAAMLAAENGLPGDDDDEWLQYAENVFEDMWSRFDSNEEETCGGGLRWALFSFNAGWDYKNTLSNACFFDLAARLARYTGNETYAEAATAAWDWMVDVELIDTSDWTVLQGTSVQENCTDASGIAESETVAYLAHGAAFMFNRTDGESDVWRERVEGLTSATLETYFPDNVAIEASCEADSNCDSSSTMYKGNAIRYLSVVSQLALSTAMDIFMAIRASAESAVEQCEGEEEGRLCGFYWATAEFVDPEEENSPGAGEEMNVLAVVSSLLIGDAAPPAISSNGNDDSDDSGSDGQDSDNDGGDSGDSGDDSEGGDNSEEGGNDSGDNGEDGDDGDSGAMSFTLSASVMMGGLVASLLMSL